MSEDQRKALLLWLNSTLGRGRAITKGAWMQMKNPAWSSMPVLDIRKLSKGKLTMLGTAYDAVSKKELCPIAQLNADKVRQEIDAVICKVLGLPDLGPIRVLLSREPGLSAEDITPAMDNEDEVHDAWRL